VTFLVVDEVEDQFGHVMSMVMTALVVDEVEDQSS
jgi:hypothetical protein